MRLTDEERAIADRVAERMAEENDADDAWGHAMLYIAARREAFGEVPTEPALTPDRDLPVWDADGEEIPPEGVAALAAEVGIDGLFSERIRMAEAAVRWCHDLEASVVPVNIVTALDALGLLRPPAPATAAGVAAPRGVVVTPEQRGALCDVKRFFDQRSEYNTDAAERRAAAVIARHVGDLLAASDWPTVMPDGTVVSAAIDAAKGGGE